MTTTDHPFSAMAIATVCGTLLSLIVTIHVHDIVETAALAAVGAVTSFVVSWLLKRVMRQHE